MRFILQEGARDMLNALDYTASALPEMASIL